jgi:ATP-binding cassette subfamily C protein
VFSAFTNILILVLPLYMLQVYDRVLPSSSLNTLLYISIAALLAVAVLGVLEIVRSQFASRVSARIEVDLGSEMFLASMNHPRAALGDVQPLRDLSIIRNFVASRALFFLFDTPFAPLFVVLLYFVHPNLFWITLLGGLLMVAVAVINQVATEKSGREAAEALGATMNSAQSFGRNFETVRALGMVGSAVEVWGNHYAASLQANDSVASANAFWGGISRTLRMLLQLATLGVGAYLVLLGEMTAGMIFAASMISSRALQPLDQVIGGWRQIAEAFGAWKRIAAIAASARRQPDRLPPQIPHGELSLTQIIYFPPDASANAQALIKGISLKIEAGETVAIIGPSQAGKSTLARLVVGAIRPRSGTVRIDGSDIALSETDEIGRHIGYLPQEVELFPGTIAQNISRFDKQPPEGEIIRAAKRSHAHALVLSQRDGYATQIGPGGVRLSGGERQRIGLARAFYGNPKILMLDEPNANLDADGEAALEKAVLEAKEQKTTVLIITHRPSIAMKCDKILMLRDGMVEAFGPAREVMARLSQGDKTGQTANRTTSPEPAELRPTPGPPQASRGSR